MWIPLIIASAVGLGLYDISKKHAVHRNAVMPVLFLATLCGSTAFCLLLLGTGRLGQALPISRLDGLRVLLKAVMVSGSWTFVYYAMRELPISIAAPIRASAPLWTVLGAVVLYHEVPGPLQALGMAVIFVGYFLFSEFGKSEGIHFLRNRGILYMFLGTLLGAACALYDKFLLQTLRLPRETMQLWFSLDLVLILGLALAAQRRAGLARTPFQWRWTIPLVGVILIFSDWLYFQALSMPETRISILSLIRRSNCLISFSVGALIFRDINVRQKVWALAAILIGVAILCLAQ